eukprot:11776398-Heterocapsa_arctica.AAC.1
MPLLRIRQPRHHCRARRRRQRVAVTPLRTSGPFLRLAAFASLQQAPRRSLLPSAASRHSRACSGRHIGACCLSPPWT